MHSAIAVLFSFALSTGPVNYRSQFSRSSKHTKIFLWSEKWKKKKKKREYVGWEFLKGSAGMLLQHISKPLYPLLGVFLYSRACLNLFRKLKSNLQLQLYSEWVRIILWNSYLFCLRILVSHLKPCQRRSYSLLLSSSRLVQNRSSNKR